MKVAEMLFAVCAVARSFEVSCTADGSCVSEETALLQRANIVHSASGSVDLATETSRTSANRSTHGYTNNDIIKINGAEVASGSGLDDMVGHCHHAGKRATQFTVCGCGVYVTAALLTECQPYSKYSQDIGFCDCGNTACVTGDLTTGYTEKFEWTAASYTVNKCNGIREARWMHRRRYSPPAPPARSPPAPPAPPPPPTPPPPAPGMHIQGQAVLDETNIDMLEGQCTPVDYHRDDLNIDERDLYAHRSIQVQVCGPFEVLLFMDHDCTRPSRGFGGCDQGPHEGCHTTSMPLHFLHRGAYEILRCRW